MKATLARLVNRRVTHWRVEVQGHLSAYRILNGSPIQAHAEHYLKRAHRHFSFWLNIRDLITPEKEF